MTQRWYTSFFSSEFWALARHEYTAARTNREVGYLNYVLRAFAPGRRVLDIGCGIGRHAIPLAALGYQVTGVDVSAWALAEAQTGAAMSNVNVTWRELDLLAAHSWADVPLVDAIVCIQSFGWGADVEQLTLLSRLRDRLAPGGILILDHSAAGTILRAYAPEATFEVDGATFELRRTFDPLTSRSQGEMVVRPAVGPVTRLHDDVRLYQPHEVSSLLQASGFNTIRADADFFPGQKPKLDTRYVQFIARNSDSSSARSTDSVVADGTNEWLDLRWSPDEAEYVRPALTRGWEPFSAILTEEVTDRARQYFLDDPYGARVAPALSRHFSCRIAPESVFVGCGATGLLRDLGALAGQGCVLQAPDGHPELAVVARRFGARIEFFDYTTDPDQFGDVIEARRPTIIVIDRPGVRGEIVDLDMIRDLSSAVARSGCILVVDETCANYAGPLASAVPLTAQTDNLVVVRSMSKGYCCGGLRFGYAIVSLPITGQVRAVATPLAASEMAITVALRLLEQGDVFGPLRQRIAYVKPVVVGSLEAAGLVVGEGDACLPWLTVPATEAVSDVLGDHRIVGKRFTYGAAPRARDLYRISVPLSAARVRAFMETFGRDTGGRS